MKYLIYALSVIYLACSSAFAEPAPRPTPIVVHVTCHFFHTCHMGGLHK